jgi:hypothetical protein
VSPCVSITHTESPPPALCVVTPPRSSPHLPPPRERPGSWGSHRGDAAGRVEGAAWGARSAAPDRREGGSRVRLGVGLGCGR